MPYILIVDDHVWKIHDEQKEKLVEWGVARSNCLALEPHIYSEVKKHIDQINLIVFGEAKMTSKPVESVPTPDSPQDQSVFKMDSSGEDSCPVFSISEDESTSTSDSN